MDRLQLPPSNNELAPRTTGEVHPGYYEAKPYYYATPGTAEINSVSEYWRIISRHKKILIVVTLVGAFLGILVALVRTPTYEARTALEIQDINENFMNMQQVNPVSEGSSYAAPADLQTQVEILQSESLIKRVLGKLQDRLPPELKVHANQSGLTAWVTNSRQRVKSLFADILPGSDGKANDQPAAESDPGSSGAPDAVEADWREAARRLKVATARQTRVIDASFDSTDPRFAASFANTLAQEFIESNVEARWKTSQQTSEWLTRELDDMRVKVEKSEDALQAYARHAGLMFTSDKTNVSEDKLRELQDQLLKAQADRVGAQSRWEISKSSPPEALTDTDTASNSPLRTLQDKITELQRQKADLLTVYTENHSKVERIEAQLEPLEAALQKERGALVDRSKNDYDAALQRERMLNAAYQDQSGVVSDQAQKSIEYNLLKHDVDSNHQLYDAMLERVKEASIASALRASNVRIVDPAEAPKLPSSPNLPIDAGVGLLSGLLLGIGVVVTRERADHTVQTPGEMQAWLNVAELQAIPASTVEDRSRLLSTGKLNGTTTLSVSGKGSSASPVELVSWQHKPSLMAECFRSLLTSILFSGENGSRPRVLVLTSAGPGEGKTTVASNLGIVLAQIKRKVLLIDADMRKPQLHKIFGLSNTHGLGTLLEGAPLAVEFPDVEVKESNIPGLFVLPSGPPTESAMNLLYSPNLPVLLARFKQQFDMVIIDTPPMLVMPDARVLGRLADGVLFITRAGHTMRDAAVAAHQRLADDKIRVLGTILNDWDPKRSPEAYGYGYRDYSYQEQAS